MRKEHEEKMKEKLGPDFRAIDKSIKLSVTTYADLLQAKKIRKVQKGYRRLFTKQSMLLGRSERRSVSPPEKCCKVSSGLYYRK